MSFLNVCDFLDAGEKSLKEKNYWSALTIALMLPNICSRIEYMGNPDYLKRDGSIHDKKCYIDWCKKYLSESSWINCTFRNDYPQILYALRCNIIHAGHANISNNEKEFILSCGDGNDDIIFEKERIINIAVLCESMFSKVKLWHATSSKKDTLCTRVLNMENKNDRQLLMEMFNKEHPKKL